MGITCFDINSEDFDIVLIGTESGAIFQGNLSSTYPASVEQAFSTEDEGVEHCDPVSLRFDHHRGRVLDVKCSPFHRDIFASIGSDEVRI